MEFTKQFAEAAQQAVLRKIEADQWESLPWLAKLVRKVASAPFTPPFDTCCDMQEIDMNGLDLGDINPVPKNEDLTPVDICGCPFGKCTCQSPISEVPKERYTPPPIKNSSRAHIQGYDWQISVLSRDKNHLDSYMLHFAHAPTQEEFEEHFVHFQRRTHYVYANEWQGGEWVSITHDYVPNFKKEKPVETFTTTEEWPEGKSFRVKFWDQRVNGYNYVYFDSKPGGIVLNKYHSAKCFAVVQARPEGV